jgi:hypothetical protein
MSHHDENFGYIPDEFVPEDVAECNAMTAKYDPSAQPGIVSWDSLEPFVREQADTVDKIRAAHWVVLWWAIARFNLIPIWQSNQGQLPSCAGWSVTNGYMTMVLYQMMLGAFRFVSINPIAMWLRTKNWSMSGGQSMCKVMMGGNQFGNYPVEHVGHYSPQFNRDMKAKINAATHVAKNFQFGACRLTGRGKELAAKIVLCLRAGMVVPIGNSVRAAGTHIDKNDMRCAMLAGTWKHATLFDGYIAVNGTVYVHWTNSHGNRYKGPDRFHSPESGCWMTLDTLTEFCSGRYVDAFCIYRAEAPINDEYIVDFRCENR